MNQKLTTSPSKLPREHVVTKSGCFHLPSLAELADSRSAVISRGGDIANSSLKLIVPKSPRLDAMDDKGHVAITRPPKSPTEVRRNRAA